MQLIRDFPSVQQTPLVMTIGNFDGVHLGHLHLLQQAQQIARSGTPAPLAAMTFEPHPLAVLRPQQALQRIGSCRDKLHWLQQAGVDMLYMPRFNKTLAAMPAEAFASLLFNQLCVRHLLIGENFRFGKNGAGNFTLLQQIAATVGAEVTAVPLLSVDKTVVSSGRVRDCLQRGDFNQTAQLLGRDWSIQGRVKRGAARGRQWGFPTANLALSFTPPLRGIFAADAQTGGEFYSAAVSIGVNPTVTADNIVQVEAHLLDFDGDLVGQKIQLTLRHKLRDEQKYDSTEALIAAIDNDVKRTREFLKCP